MRFHLRDYRDETGTYDGVASIEMFEAVGEKWWPTYFDTVRRVLAPGGRASIQAITIADARFERYRSQSDFIQQHIFPGGMLASPSRFRAEAACAGLSVRNVRDFGPDYAETLRRWLAAFDREAGAIRGAGIPRALHPLLALLPRLLRRRLRQRLDRCVAVHAGCRLA